MQSRKIESRIYINVIFYALELYRYTLYTYMSIYCQIALLDYYYNICMRTEKFEYIPSTLQLQTNDKCSKSPVVLIAYIIH